VDEVAVTMIAAKNNLPPVRVQQVTLNGQALLAEKPPPGVSSNP